MFPGIARAGVQMLTGVYGSEGPFSNTRIIKQMVVDGYVYTDQKTGCQWLLVNDGSNVKIDLGCFPEYISEEFKK